MTNQQKQEFTRRISQANGTELTVIVYDIALTYLQEGKAAIEEGNETEYILQLQKGEKCINDCITSLNFLYEPAKNLHEIYLYIKTCLRKARMEKKVSLVEEAISHIKTLRDAYESITDQDTFGPVMEHAQTVTAGLTYGKNAVCEDLTDNSSNRGFCV